jgi:hypothetical protein
VDGFINIDDNSWNPVPSVMNRCDPSLMEHAATHFTFNTVSEIMGVFVASKSIQCYFDIPDELNSTSMTCFDPVWRKILQSIVLLNQNAIIDL